MTTTKATITFQELGLSAVILKALKEIGFETPFPIQKAAIPLLSKGSCSKQLLLYIS
jgi:ATP-dependent RNA helicase DeaD